MQDDSSMPPVLVREDVIGEFMESCKKERKKKAQMLNHVLKTAKSSVKLHSAKTPERSVGWQPYNNHPVGPMQQLFVPLMCQLSLTCPLPIRRLALLCNLLP